VAGGASMGSGAQERGCATDPPLCLAVSRELQIVLNWQFLTQQTKKAIPKDGLSCS